MKTEHRDVRSQSMKAAWQAVRNLRASHDQLVAALREIDDMLKGDLPITDAVKQIARNALAAAEKGQP